MDQVYSICKFSFRYVIVSKKKPFKIYLWSTLALNALFTYKLNKERIVAGFVVLFRQSNITHDDTAAAFSHPSYD